jgi:hypothetical protein
VYEEFQATIEHTEETEQEKADRRSLTLSYLNAFTGEGRKALKDLLRHLGPFKMIDPPDDAGQAVMHNEAILILMKLGILNERKDCVDRIVDALMEIPRLE